MTPPHITLWNTGLPTEWYEVREGSLKRDFLDETLNSHGYHCSPISSANLHGWEFILPQDVEVVWDGISDTSADHVKIIRGEVLPSGTPFVHTDTANGTIAFNLNCFIETDENHYTLISGAPNYFINGAKPLSALIRSDIWSFTPIQFCWKITTPNKPVIFEKGMPFAFLLNYPIQTLQSTTLNIKKASKEILAKSSEYGDLRKLKYDEFNGKNYPMLYKKHSIDNKIKIKPAPKKPVVES